MWRSAARDCDATASSSSSSSASAASCTMPAMGAPLSRTSVRTTPGRAAADAGQACRSSSQNDDVELRVAKGRRQHGPELLPFERRVQPHAELPERPRDHQPATDQADQERRRDRRDAEAPQHGHHLRRMRPRREPPGHDEGRDDEQGDDADRDHRPDGATHERRRGAHALGQRERDGGEQEHGQRVPQGLEDVADHGRLRVEQEERVGRAVARDMPTTDWASDRTRRPGPRRRTGTRRGG